MDDKKQIEEMAKDFCKYCLLKFGVDDIDKGIEFCQFKDDCNTINKAKYFYEQGYRNCKDKVVLTMEEYKEMVADVDVSKEKLVRIIDSAKAKARKETAREIFKALFASIKYSYSAGFELLEPEQVKEIAKQYGVEVE